MLSRLSIQNYAIIDQLDIDYSSNLNIITGETGAGKSIIIGALGLILGQRSDGSSLLNREKKCIIEGVFSHLDKDENVAAFFKEQELDSEEELVLRREISPSGKSRAFINDTPVNLSQLAGLSKLLVDLHQQFDTLELGETDFQRQVMDALAGNAALLKTYRQGYTEVQRKARELQTLKDQKTLFTKEFDYHQFQYTELEEAGFAEDELENAEVQIKLLSNAEGIKTALSKTYFELEESEDPVVRQLKALCSSLQPFTDLHPELPQLTQRLQSACIELQDIAEDVDRISNSIGLDAASLEQLNERLSIGYKLLKKHGLKTTAELLQLKKELEEKLQAVLNIDEAILTAEKGHADSLQAALAKAAEISTARQAQVKPLETRVNKMLAQVGMPNARLKVVVQPTQTLQPHGTDNLEFLFDANRSGQFNPLRKVASGGELSRLMLCIKSLVAASMNMPTLIFDEIDTGISGEAARQVGVILKDLAAARQVLCITHQPQIAGKADAHYLVYKAVKGSAITTGVRLLSTDERIITIAKMMSGEKPTAAALENAKEMVMN